MQIIIDIDDRIYKIVQNKTLNIIDSEIVEKAIINGTPLPKHHGRLGDLDAVMNDISTSINARINIGIAIDGEYLWAKLNDAIYNAPTIIEADNESEEL